MKRKGEKRRKCIEINAGGRALPRHATLLICCRKFPFSTWANSFCSCHQQQSPEQGQRRIRAGPDQGQSHCSISTLVGTTSSPRLKLQLERESAESESRGSGLAWCRWVNYGHKYNISKMWLPCPPPPLRVALLHCCGSFDGRFECHSAKLFVCQSKMKTRNGKCEN